MKVNIERIKELRAELNEINSVDIEDIEFYENGEKVDVPQEHINNWRFIGLNNIEFITTEFYLDG